MSECKKRNSIIAPSTLAETELKNPPAGYYKTDVWKAVPMVDSDMPEGIEGGEGCQWPLYIEMDSFEGKLAFFGTDVGGIYRSLDGGKNWTPCTVGFYACGATGIAIDPNNINRILAIGANSITSDCNGVYLSENAGESWSNTYPARVGSYRDFRKQTVWDKSSYDEKLGGSRIAYWSREAFDHSRTQADKHPALYKTEDGGYTWFELPGCEQFADAEIAVHPETGALYAATKEGLFVSRDGAKTFEKLLDIPVYSIDLIYTRPDNLYAISNDGLYVTTDAGKTFTKICGKDYPTTVPRHLRVSPVNPDNMVLQDELPNYAAKVYYTNDGGKSWAETVRDCSLSWIPFNCRQNVFAWSPVDENTFISLGGDFMMRSTDAGKTLVWSSSGYNGMMTGGMFTFNVNHPGWTFDPSQDYNGGYTLDGGKTWKYVKWYEFWGGYTYGGYVISENSLVCGGTDHVHGLEVWTTFDGGKTVNNTGHMIKGKQVAMGVPGNDDIIFMGEWRSTDAGHNWTEMPDCDGVFTYNKKTGRLYGCKGDSVVISDDEGASWQTYADIGARVNDIAWQANTDDLIVVGGESAFRVSADRSVSLIDDMPRGVVGDQHVMSVAVDGKNSDIIYVGCRNGVVETQCSVIRSVDNGKTWVRLNRYIDDGRVGPDGAKEASCIRICSENEYLFVGTCCRGMWKMPVPQI